LMVRKSIIFACLASIIVFAFFKTVSMVQITPVDASPTTWTVDDDGPADFSSIQEAINSSQVVDGDTIYVYNGTYHEHLDIRKHNLTIAGENPENTIIDGDGTGSVVFLNAHNVSIAGFTVRNGFFGINMNHASNCTINGNRITSNKKAIMLGGEGLLIQASNNNTISNNVIDANEVHAINLDQSSQNMIVDNLLAANGRGMLLTNCRHSVLRDNNMTGNVYNFGVCGGAPIDFVHDIDTSNVVDEKPIYYLVDRNDLIMNPSTFSNVGYLAVINSNNITIRELDLANNYQGILFANTSESSIEHVTASHNLLAVQLVFSSNNTISNNLMRPSAAGVTGIRLDSSEHNMLSNNGFDSCQTGIYLVSDSSNNTIINNQISNNQKGLILQTSSIDNLIYHNNFVNNTQQAEASSYSYNIWDNGYPSGGNFWDNYTGEDLYSGAGQNEPGRDEIGDTPYIIDSNNQDHYPLMAPLLMPDLNKDGIVDILDIAMVGRAYGSTPADSNWNQYCDVDYSGSVDIADVAIVARNYGKTF
jgi:parallel beta-helix repeat protein